MTRTTLTKRAEQASRELRSAVTELVKILKHKDFPANRDAIALSTDLVFAAERVNQIGEHLYQRSTPA